MRTFSPTLYAWDDGFTVRWRWAGGRGRREPQGSGLESRQLLSRRSSSSPSHPFLSHPRSRTIPQHSRKTQASRSDLLEISQPLNAPSFKCSPASIPPFWPPNQPSAYMKPGLRLMRLQARATRDKARIGSFGAIASKQAPHAPPSLKHSPTFIIPYIPP